MRHMKDLKQKIKNTALFTPEEKVEILAAIDTFSESDVSQLESIVDEYDLKYQNILHTFKSNMLQELDAMVNTSGSGDKVRLADAARKIRDGFNAVLPT